MIEIIKVLDRITGNEKAHEILAPIVDKQTLLALSGGTSPDYREILIDVGDILPGAVCLVDERYGTSYHDDSNELLIKNFGLLDFLELRDIKFYKILTGEDIETTTKKYNETIATLFKQFPKKVGVMGVSENLHTAGIFPESPACKSPDFVVSQQVNDRNPNRITITFKALGEFQTFVILAFGGEKKEALLTMLNEKENDMQKYPAIFYRKCLAKCYLITDQEVSK